MWLCLYLFFFFKQKTAYEMRISDWSSDVCSSDLYEFLDRLVTIAMPRIRDFRGLNPKSFDGHGNYAFGIKEQIIFPEINYDRIDKVRGMDIIVTTTARTDEEARELLRLFGFPFPAEAEKQAA